MISSYTRVALIENEADVSWNLQRPELPLRTLQTLPSTAHRPKWKSILDRFDDFSCKNTETSTPTHTTSPELQVKPTAKNTAQEVPKAERYWCNLTLAKTRTVSQNSPNFTFTCAPRKGLQRTFMIQMSWRSTHSRHSFCIRTLTSGRKTCSVRNTNDESHKSRSTSLHPTDVVDGSTFSGSSFWQKMRLHNSSASDTKSFSCKITEKLSLTRLPELWRDQKHNYT